jgi:hypothetical protein
MLSLAGLMGSGAIKMRYVGDRDLEVRFTHP